jgi:CHAT domain-containing protein
VQPSISKERPKRLIFWSVFGCLFLLCVLARLFVPVWVRESPLEAPTPHTVELPRMRLTEGRLSGQSEYAPYQTFTDKSLQPVFGRLLDSGSLHDRAIFHLLTNNLDRAVADMEEAVRQAPAQALLLSDLSALYGERARAKNQPEDYIAALEMAERAVAVGPDVPEANFNDALALEHLFLQDKALNIWRHFLLIGGMASSWLREAEGHVRRLSIEDRTFEDQHRRSSLNGALAIFHQALDRLRDFSEDPEMAEMQNQSASVLESLGQPAEAWRHRFLALGWTSGLSSNDYRLDTREVPGDASKIPIAIETFEGAAQASIARRWPKAALQFQTRAVFLALAFGDPARTAFALLTRARIEAALGKQEAARRDFLGAMNLLPRERIAASDLLAAQADIVRSEIADAEGRSAAIAYENFIPEHLDQQADVDFRRGGAVAGEKSLERALDEVDRRRTKVASGRDRVSFFDQARPLYERLVALEVHRALPEKALEALERFHARALFDQAGALEHGADASPLTGENLLKRIPEHTVLAVYAAVDGQLFTLLVRRSGVWMSPHQADWQTISFWIQRLQESPGEEADHKALLGQLFGELVAPWKTDLDDSDRIIFVPTGDLYKVPFAALLDQVSGRFLIEDHAVGVAPSASEFVAAVERDHRRSARPAASVLLVGNPVRSSKEGLPPLPAAAGEIQSLKGIYRGRDVQVLTGAEATPGRVLAALGKADIAHLAVHAIDDFEDPTRSRLVLSPSKGDRGELSERELLRTRLSRTRLVVLAACGSHAGPISASEGALSLAYSFLAAGVPAVLGTLQVVDDESTARLSVRFHQELLRGADALSALRTAQREEIAARGPRSNWTWASFQVYGGVEEKVP